MREIKFKAWDKHKKVFIPNEFWAVVTTDFGAFGIMLKDWENYKEGEYFYENSQELIQFTGLHDRNGKEWYEGYLVRVNKDAPIHETFWSENEMGWKIRLVSQKENWFNINAPIFEIIGNRFENPELL